MNLPGPTPSSSAAAIVARKHAVPDALSQLNANTAGYGAGVLVTGGTRMIRLCNPGTFSPFSAVAFLGSQVGSRPLLNLSSHSFTAGSPHASTKPTSNRYGIQAMNTSAPECLCARIVAGLSPSSRKMFFGFQNFSTSTMQPMQVSELRMSVSSGPM